MASPSELSKMAASGGGEAQMHANHIAPQGGNYEPQRNYNFTFEVNLGNAVYQEIISLSVVSASIPEWTNQPIQLKYMNETRNVIGRPEFQECQIVFHDYVDRSVAEALYKWYSEGYDVQTGKVGLARDYKKQCVLNQYAPNGQLSRTWKLMGCFLSRCKWGDANMEGNEACKIELTITYDKGIPTFSNTVFSSSAQALSSYKKATSGF